MRFFLKANFVLIKGVKRGAIYDLKKGDVYDVVPRSVKQLESIEQDEKFWRILVKEGLAIRVKNKPKIVISSPTPKLNFVWLEVNEDCNFKCIHCYGGWGKKRVEKKYKDVNWYKVIDFIKLQKCSQIQIIGGEPLLFPDLKNLIKYSKKVGIELVEVFTNGSLLNDEWLEFFKSMNVDLAISLHTVNDKKFKKITQSKFDVNLILSNIRKAKKIGLKLRVATVVMKQNQNDLVNIQKECPVKNLRFDVVRPSKDLKMGSLLPKKQIQSNLAFFTSPPMKTSKKDFELKKYFNSCWMGRMAITTNGDIIPCIFARTIVVGNINEDSLETAYEKLVEKYWSFNLDKVEKCAGCEYRYVCKNCRPLAMGYSGRLEAPNPYCKV
jgi:radical SAM protein with 4Fe4S-binding SPASM domain